MKISIMTTSTINDAKTTAYFNIARRNHRWVILGILHLSDKSALERFDRELKNQERDRRIRPCAWGIQKSLKTL